MYCWVVPTAMVLVAGLIVIYRKVGELLQAARIRTHTSETATSANSLDFLFMTPPQRGKKRKSYVAGKGPSTNLD